MKKITISSAGKSIEAMLYETETAETLYKSLPIEGTVSMWGDEIFFKIPINIELASDAQEYVEIGELAYFPQSPALCIFFGQTPASTDERPKANSPVNIFGMVLEGLEKLNDIQEGDNIIVSKN